MFPKITHHKNILSIAFTAVSLFASLVHADGNPGGSGGGNGIKGKVFEAYAVDPTQTDAYLRFVKPIATHLQRILDYSNQQTNADKIDCGGRSELEVYALYKSWYIVPTQLASIAKQNLGVQFFMDPIQQMALQSDREVWIARPIWQQMSVHEQARLLLHEIVESVYLTRFMSAQEFANIILKSCVMTTAATQAYMSLSDQNDPDMKADEKKRPLNASDYAMIRGATEDLLANYRSVNSMDDLDKIFAKYNFSHRFISDSSEEKPSSKKENFTFNLGDFSKNADGTQGFCGSGNIDSQKTPCVIVAATGGVFTLASMQDGSILQSFKEDPSTSANGNDLQACPSGYGDCFFLEFGPTMEQYKTLKVGDEFQVVNIWIQQSEIPESQLDRNGKEIKTSRKLQEISEIFIDKQRVVSTKSDVVHNGSFEFPHVKMIAVSLENKSSLIFSKLATPTPMFRSRLKDITGGIKNYELDAP